MYGQHADEDAHRIHQAVSAEEHHRGAEQHKGDHHPQQLVGAGLGVDVQRAHHCRAQRHQRRADDLVQTVQQAPGHIVPLGTVPQAADGKGDQHV